LYAKAKESPDLRFYSLADKMYREDVLRHAYRCCKHNGGVAGVDGQSFEDIEAYGLDLWLSELAEALRSKSYRPEPVLRCYILKDNGKQRPLGIPTIRDRVAQMAAVVVIQPIFEADLQPEQYGYRPKRSAHDAIKAVHALVNTGHTEVVDADLSGYFDTIPHADLMKSVSRRISDGWMLKLIKMWLKAPVVETDKRDRRRRKPSDRDRRRGTPQGAPLSPLLANIYMRRFILGWKLLGLEDRLQARIVNYADDFVICCRGTAQGAMDAMRRVMERLKLTVNETKTSICHIPEGRFDFLSYTIGRCYSPRTGRAYLGSRPSQKAIQKLCREISQATHRRWVLREPEELVAQLNRKLVGWANYFRLGPVSKAYRSVDAHTRHRLRQWLQAKHKTRTGRYTRFPDAYLYETLGLVKLPERTRNLPWATG
jgi:group II intron reverse transcriptase/maturase